MVHGHWKSYAQAAQPTGSTQDFINDMYAGKPILGQFVTALASGDQNTLDNFIKDCGYEMDSKVLQAAASAAQPGPNFDIASVGGAYNFTAPADMTAKTLKINPGTKELYVSKVNTAYTVDVTTGTVTFSYNGFTYSIIFTTVYDDDGNAEDIIFNGQRKNLTTTEDVTGEKTKPDDKNAWAETPGMVSACWVLTLGGVIVTILFYLCDKAGVVDIAKEKVVELWGRKARRALEINKARVRDNLQVQVQTALGSIPNQDQIKKDFPRDVRLAIEKAVKKSRDAGKDEAAAVHDGVLAGAKTFEKMVVEFVTPRSQGGDGVAKASEHAIGTEEVEATRKELIVDTVRRGYSGLGESSQWFKDIAQSKLCQCISEEKDRQAKAAAKDMDSAASVAAKKRDSADKLQEAANNYKRDMVDTAKTEVEIARANEEWTAMKQEALEERKAANEALDGVLDLVKEKEDAEKESNKAKEDKKKAEDRAKRNAAEAFEFHGE